jgi:cysteine-rich repeat protein
MCTFKGIQVGVIPFFLGVGCLPSPSPGTDDLISASGTAETSTTDSPTDTSVVTSTDADSSTSVSSSTSAAVCGDKIVDAGEDCDDGNSENTDECVNCKPATCGDGEVRAGVELCDDGNSENTDACVVCEPARCGDSNVQMGVEECDDGKNGNNADACTDECKKAACGDGFVQKGEECDDGNMVDTDTCTNCKLAVCGDGIAQAGEECDDGNEKDMGDDCPNSCFLDRRVFLTSKIYCGNMNGFAEAACNGDPLNDDVTGVARGDARCNAAKTARDGFTFRAWLSDGQNSPGSRFKASTEGFAGRYVLLNGTIVVAGGWTDLVDGSFVPITIMENGMPFTPAVVWTNTKADGLPNNGGHCAGWQSTVDVQAGYGKNVGMGKTWSDSGMLADCLNPGRIYCFEDPKG